MTSIAQHPGLPRASRRSVLKAGAGAAALALGWPLAHAQAARKITISYPTRSGASWPMWIAKHGGLYEKHGLDVNLEFGVHPAGVAMLVSGQAQMINYGLGQVLTATAREPSMVIMGSSLNKGSFALVARKGLKSYEDLRGKRIGIGRLGDPLYVYTLKLLQKNGMGARDVQWVPSGRDANSRVTMLQGGQLDASLMVAPAYYRLEDQGYEVVDLLVNHADIFVSTAYVFMKSWVKDNADTATKLIQAHADAIARFYEDKAFAVQAYRAFDPQNEADVSRVYDTYKAKDVLERVPLLQREAVDTTVAQLTEEIPALKTMDVAQVIDMGPVRRLIADGYFRQVFGPGVAAREKELLSKSF